MYNPDTDLLFPPRAIPSLSDLRGEIWNQLVAHVLAAAQESASYLAFILLMARLNGCATCNADSYRAMHGCKACAQQTLKRFRGSDEDLTAQYQSALAEIEEYLKINRK